MLIYCFLFVRFVPYRSICASCLLWFSFELHPAVLFLRLSLFLCIFCADVVVCRDVLGCACCPGSRRLLIAAMSEDWCAGDALFSLASCPDRPGTGRRTFPSLSRTELSCLRSVALISEFCAHVGTRVSVYCVAQALHRPSVSPGRTSPLSLVDWRGILWTTSAFGIVVSGLRVEDRSASVVSLVLLASSCFLAAFLFVPDDSFGCKSSSGLSRSRGVPFFVCEVCSH